MKRNGLWRKLILRLLGEELHLSSCPADGGIILVKVSKAFSEKRARKWLWIGLGAMVALQIYFVQEMLAVLILFTGIFIVGAIVALVLYLTDRAGQWGLGWAGNQAKRAVIAAEEISKKQLRRPRSEPAQ